MRRKTRG
jgi:hypothetical protein